MIFEMYNLVAEQFGIIEKRIENKCPHAGRRNTFKVIACNTTLVAVNLK
jgi:hypothetical protein